MFKLIDRSIGAVEKAASQAVRAAYAHIVPGFTENTDPATVNEQGGLCTVGAIFTIRRECKGDSA